MAKMTHVEFKGRTFWITPEALEGNGDSALAPEDHVTDGKLNTGDGRNSYAHVFGNGEILRYGEVIGHREDLKRIP